MKIFKFILLIITIILFSLDCFAEIYIDYNKIAMIESSDEKNIQAYNTNRYAIGKYQISSDVLKEYNQYNRTNL